MPYERLKLVVGGKTLEDEKNDKPAMVKFVDGGVYKSYLYIFLCCWDLNRNLILIVRLSHIKKIQASGQKSKRSTS